VTKLTPITTSWMLDVLVGVLVPTNTKLTHVFGSKVLILVLVCYKLILTPPYKHGFRLPR
jgi:hypothetical protein